ncbi:hypothetical protein F383_38769 [Gossypium arboreum]|uniref:Uncharacterized protein n=1 Tax=Gossypium arboreum TaxID=29729 RepID=A0A0B0MDF4_GOSAR|nr:hypothetical protein F383_38769 [Gossypium arboreum]
MSDPAIMSGLGLGCCTYLIFPLAHSLNFLLNPFLFKLTIAMS